MILLLAIPQKKKLVQEDQGYSDILTHIKLSHKAGLGLRYV